jgi:hypothetical protein
MPATIVVSVDGRIARAGIPSLCERVRVCVDACAGEFVICDVASIDDPDAVTVDALARMQLVACRSGRRILLRNACAELRDLIELAGLSEPLPVVDAVPGRELGRPPASPGS